MKATHLATFLATLVLLCQPIVAEERSNPELKIAQAAECHLFYNYYEKYTRLTDPTSIIAEYAKVMKGKWFVAYTSSPLEGGDQAKRRLTIFSEEEAKFVARIAEIDGRQSMLEVFFKDLNAQCQKRRSEYPDSF